MLTLHTAPLLLPVGSEPVPDGAVLVEHDRIAAIGPRTELESVRPEARVRAWPGVLTPGLRQWHAVFLLKRCYHPDPREADLLGTEPLTGDALDTLELNAARWSGSVRRGLQQMLRHGTTAVAVTAGDPLLAAPVARSGLAAVPVVGAPAILVDAPSLDPFVAGADLAGSVAGPLAAGGRADFAVFDVPDGQALLERGAAACVATVIAGRLLYRRR
ncbi:hypothetical protein LG634_30040 [Streptomyces bambusae]|uniref:imidazolonepropionase-like domain-containing protein n=1 Tax=Streptomyces bambusae TaxID=1550616 RepID=UPI001CFC4C3C|nr:hypothetical protein [Streptomyces bambusae]MCB5169041.1 hypothetical protein [Streptomyces bambusae]